jgi:hypothetical protein
MGSVEIQHQWFPDDQPWNVEVNKRQDGSVYLVINFPQEEDSSSHGCMFLNPDIAENLARQILDALVDSRLGRYTNDFSV